MELDSVMWFASCTKLFTTIAALQCVERGLLDLDGDISEILPEFKGVQILTGFDEKSQKPILIDNHKTITLRFVVPARSWVDRNHETNRTKTSPNTFIWAFIRCFR